MRRPGGGITPVLPPHAFEVGAEQRDRHFGEPRAPIHAALSPADDHLRPRQADLFEPQRQTHDQPEPRRVWQAPGEGRRVAAAAVERPQSGVESGRRRHRRHGVRPVGAHVMLRGLGRALLDWPRRSQEPNRRRLCFSWTSRRRYVHRDRAAASVTCTVTRRVPDSVIICPGLVTSMSPSSSFRARSSLWKSLLLKGIKS